MPFTLTSTKLQLFFPVDGNFVPYSTGFFHARDANGEMERTRSFFQQIFLIGSRNGGKKIVEGTQTWRENCYDDHAHFRWQQRMKRIQHSKLRQRIKFYTTMKGKKTFLLFPILITATTCINNRQNWTIFIFFSVGGANIATGRLWNGKWRDGRMWCDDKRWWNGNWKPFIQLNHFLFNAFHRPLRTFHRDIIFTRLY